MIDSKEISIQGAMLQPLRLYAMKLLSRIKIILYEKGLISYHGVEITSHEIRIFPILVKDIFSFLN